MELTPEIVKLLVQVGGTPAALGFVLYFLYTHGPKAELERMTNTVQEIRNDLNQHRDQVLTQQAEHRERIQRLEIVADYHAEQLRARTRGYYTEGES